MPKEWCKNHTQEQPPHCPPKPRKEMNAPVRE